MSTSGIFVVFAFGAIGLIIQKWTSSHGAVHGDDAMHDLLIALAFIGMVVAPAVVAAKSGADSADELDD